MLFYDIETFKFDSLVVFKNIQNQVVAHYWSKGYDKNDEPNGFEDVEALVTNETLVGYNNHHYDDHILTAMMMGLPQKYIKKQNDMIIEGREGVIPVSKALHTLDTMQQIDVSVPSLKKIEGNMGRSILESSVPFDIDRPLTQEEKDEVLKYCCYDVETTIEVYKLREKSYFNVKDELLAMMTNPKPNSYKWNTTVISANILMERPQPMWYSYKGLEKLWKNIKGIPAEVWEMWEAPLKDKSLDNKSITVPNMFGKCNVVFGFGGLHGAPTKPVERRNVKLLDVGSMYPSIIILLNALGDSTKLYDDIRRERLRIKHIDKTKSNALKLILNSVYGNLKNQYSTLYNPNASTTVCIFGQLALFTLCRKLNELGYEVININTDGVAFVDNPILGNAYEDVWHEWEAEFGLTLELDEFDWWLQKDVNNYIATQNGHVKVKGGEVNKYNEEKLFSNNDARIIHIATVEQLLHKDDPTIALKTIINNLDKPKLYQYILKAGRTYNGVIDDKGNRYQNVNRVFAMKPRYEGIKLYKERMDGGLVNFPNMPQNMLLWNDDVDKIERFKDMVDVNHYYSVVQEKLKGWC